MSSAFHEGDDDDVVARTVTTQEPVAHYIDGVFHAQTDAVRHGPFVPQD